MPCVVAESKQNQIAGQCCQRIKSTGLYQYEDGEGNEEFAHQEKHIVTLAWLSPICPVKWSTNDQRDLPNIIPAALQRLVSKKDCLRPNALLSVCMLSSA